MILGIQGSRNFNDYNIFLFGMRVLLSDMKDGDKSITIYSAGPSNLNSMAMEFVNVSERGFKARGISVKLIKLPPKVLVEKMIEMDYFSYFRVPKEADSPLMREASDKDIDVKVFQY